MTCPDCGFGCALDACAECARRHALEESRRADLRAWLDRRPRPSPWIAINGIDKDGYRHVGWRDFGEPIARSARTGPDACGGGRCSCEVCEKGRQAAVKGAPFDERPFDGSAPNGDKLGA